MESDFRFLSVSFLLTFLFKPFSEVMTKLTMEGFSQILTLAIQVLVLISVIYKLKHIKRKNNSK